MLVGLHFRSEYRFIDRERGVGPGVQVGEDFVPAVGFVFGVNQADGTHGTCIDQRILRCALREFDRETGIKGQAGGISAEFIQHLLWPVLFHRQREGEDFAQRFHRECFVDVSCLVNFAVNGSEGNGEVVGAVSGKGRDVVGDFSIVITFVLLMSLFYQLGVVGRGLRECGCAKQDTERKETHAENCFIHYAFLLVCSSWCRMAAYRLIRPTDS